MIRLLDIPQAVQARGWPEHLAATVTIDLAPTSDTEPPQRLALVIADGKAHTETTTAPADVTMTRRQLAAWYAGSYRSTASALLSGVRADSHKALTTLINATGDAEPWLPDLF